MESSPTQGPGLNLFPFNGSWWFRRAVQYHPIHPINLIGDAGFDPRIGTATPRYRSVSVMAPTAAVADAFSTAFSIMDKAAIRTAARAKQAKVWLVMPDNRIETPA